MKWKWPGKRQCNNFWYTTTRKVWFLWNIIAGDESWNSQYNPELKQQSTEYHHPSPPHHKKSEQRELHEMVMLTVFWDSEGVVHYEFVPIGSIIIQSAIFRHWRLCYDDKNMFDRITLFSLQHDNVWPHTSAATITAMEWLDFHIILHPPYSLDLAPSNYYLFCDLKKHLKSQCYSLDDELKTVALRSFHLQSSEFYETGTRKLISLWLCCIELDSDHVKIKLFKRKLILSSSARVPWYFPM